MTDQGDTGNSAAARVQAMLQKGARGPTSLDPDALNLVTTPEYANLRGNVISHLTRRLVKEKTEGKAGRNPEEVLGKGARNLIKIKPVFMKPKRQRIGQSGAKRLEALMNRGVKHKAGQVPIEEDGDENASEETSALSQGLGKVMRGKYKTQPGKLRAAHKVKRDMRHISSQEGLQAQSEKNFNDKEKARKRKKLDVTGF